MTEYYLQMSSPSPSAVDLAAIGAHTQSLAMFAALAMLVCAFVSVTAYEDAFTYVKPNYFQRAGDEECKICYGDNDCLTINLARCDYYRTTSEVLFDDDGPDDSTSPELRIQVDSLMMGLAEWSYDLQAHQECIPFVSQYTSCNKENVCLGCSFCTCSESSRWNCSFVQRCKPEEHREVDHRTLVIAMETLKGEGTPSFRLKRSAPTPAAAERHKITFEELAEWMYEANPSNDKVYTTTSERDSMIGTTSTEKVNILTMANGDTTMSDNFEFSNGELDYIAFDDVLNNIAIQNKNYSRRKPLNITNHDKAIVFDSMKLDDDHVRLDEISGIKAADHFVNILNAIEAREKSEEITTTERVTKMVIDLLELARKRMDTASNNFNDTDSKVTLQNESVFNTSDDTYEYNVINLIKRDLSQVTENNLNFAAIGKIENTFSKKEVLDINYPSVNGIKQNMKVTLQNGTGFDNTENAYNLNVIGIMKRDVSQVSNDNLNLTATEKINISNTTKELKDGVYLPINSIIQDKQKELDDLIRVREKLTKYLNLNRSREHDLNKTERVENSSNSYISFYNVKITPETDSEIGSKRSGTELLDKYLKKLRRDMYIIVKDIIRIQTITGPEDFPNDLKMLTHAIKHYMRNHTKSHRKNKLRTFDNISDLRRHQENSNMPRDFVKNYLINIFLLIDRDMPQTNALAPLSQKTRKIIKRVIKYNNLNDDVTVIPIKINDPNHNLTNDLTNIGVSWQDMSVKISDSTPWDRLHHLKLLQLILASDIDKMKDALALIDFAHSRRMLAIYDDVGKDELIRINTNLKAIQSRIKNIAKLPSFHSKPDGKIVKVFTITKQKKKQTFLRHIKNLLKSSKRDIANLLHRKVPKSEIIKELAKKKLNDLTKRKLLEYENAMQKWQNDLDITRRKRSFVSVNSNMRTKNILPKYLRGKVSSGMNSTKHKNKSKTKHSQRRQNRRKNKNESTATEKSPKTEQTYKNESFKP